jgi:hypothetical protein
MNLNRSVNEAKKAIWLRLQAYTGDDELWDDLTFEDDFHPDTVIKARETIINQLERKL